MIQKRVPYLALKNLIAVGLRDDEISRVETNRDHCGSRNRYFPCEMLRQSQNPATRRDCLGCIEGDNLLLSVDTRVRTAYVSDEGSTRIHCDNRSVQFARHRSRISLPRHAMKMGTIVRDPQKHPVTMFFGHVNACPRILDKFAVADGIPTTFWISRNSMHNNRSYN